jgi:hypothetical protein
MVPLRPKTQGGRENGPEGSSSERPPVNLPSDHNILGLPTLNPEGPYIITPFRV